MLDVKISLGRQDVCILFLGFDISCVAIQVSTHFRCGCWYLDCLVHRDGRATRMGATCGTVLERSPRPDCSFEHRLRLPSLPDHVFTRGLTHRTFTTARVGWASLFYLYETPSKICLMGDVLAKTRIAHDLPIVPVTGVGQPGGG